MRKLIVIWLMVASGLAAADTPPSLQKIRDCQAFVSFLSQVAKARKYNYFPPDKINEKFLKEKFGGNGLGKGLGRWMSPSTKEEEAALSKIEDIAIKMVVDADRFSLDSYASGDTNGCREFANEIVVWKPINK